MSNLGGSYNSYEQLRATEFRLGKASRDAEVEDLRRQLVETEQDRQYQLATKANYMSDLNKVEEKLASRDAEILELKNNVTICVVRMGELRQQLDDSQTQLKWVKTTYEGLKSRVHNPSGYLKQISELRQKLDVARGLLDCSSGWIRFGSSKERDMYTKIQAFLKEQS